MFLRRLTLIEPQTMPNSRKLDDAAEHGLNQPFIEEVTNHITSTEDSFIEEPTVSNNKIWPTQRVGCCTI